MHILNFLKPKAEVAFIESDATIRQCLEKMAVRGYTAIPVLNIDGTYAGTITEGDLLWFIKDHAGLDIYKAEDIALSGVSRRRDNTPVDVNASMDTLFRLSLRQNFTPVLDDRNMFIGIVTRHDIINFYQSHLNLIEEEETVNPTLRTIMGRRSIRRYTDEPVSENDIQQIIDAALAAPTAKNLQPVHVLVISQPDIKGRLAASARYGKMIADSSLALAVYGDSSKETRDFYLNNDCSAAIENALIAIESLGLGGVWIGTANAEETAFLRDELHIPSNMVLYGLIALGHPSEEKLPHESAEEAKIHYNKW